MLFSDKELFLSTYTCFLILPILLLWVYTLRKNHCFKLFKKQKKYVWLDCFVTAQILKETTKQ